MHIENLRPGKSFVAVLEDATMPRPIDPSYGRPSLNGIPFKVLAVSPPFVTVETIHGQVHGFDTRDVTLTPVTRQYYAAWAEHRNDVSDSDIRRAVRDRQRERKRRKKRQEGLTETGHPACRRCDTRLRERCVNGEWRYFCPECDWDGGPSGGAQIILPKDKP